MRLRPVRGQEGAVGIRIFVIPKQKIEKAFKVQTKSHIYWPSNKSQPATLTHLQIKISSTFILVWFSSYKRGYVMSFGYQIWLLSSNWWRENIQITRTIGKFNYFFFSFPFHGTTLYIQAKKGFLWCIKFIGSSNCFYCIMQDSKLVLLYSKSVYNVFKVLFRRTIFT